MSYAHLREARRFLSVGVVNTVVGFTVICAAKWLLRLGDVAANALGYSVGLLVSFVLNGRWTFAYRGPRLPTLAKFLVVTFVAYGMNLVTVLFAIRFFGLNGYLAQAVGIVPYTLTTFLASKYFVFRTQ